MIPSDSRVELFEVRRQAREILLQGYQSGVHETKGVVVYLNRQVWQAGFKLGKLHTLTVVNVEPSTVQWVKK